MNETSSRERESIKRSLLEERLKVLDGKKVVGCEVDNSAGIVIKFEGNIELRFTSWWDDQPDYDGVVVEQSEG